MRGLSYGSHAIVKVLNDTLDEILPTLQFAEMIKGRKYLELLQLPTQKSETSQETKVKGNSLDSLFVPTQRPKHLEVSVRERLSDAFL